MRRPIHRSTIGLALAVASFGCSAIVGGGYQLADGGSGGMDAGSRDAGPTRDAGDAGDDAGTDAGPELRRIGGLSAGKGFTCAFTEGDGRVYCWGLNNQSQLGRGATPGDLTVPAPVVLSDAEDLTGATQVAAGSEHACARIGGADSAEVRCWGRNDKGQIGNDGASFNNAFPLPFEPAAGSPFSTVRSVAAGQKHTCALLGDGTFWCSGLGASGQIGDGARMDRDLPVQVHGLMDMGFLMNGRAVAASTDLSCALTTYQPTAAICWGLRPCGASQGVPVVARDFGTAFAQLEAGDGYICVISPGGSISCTGANDVGQLGDGVTDGACNTGVATVVHPDGGDLMGVNAFSAGVTHACASTATDTFCWGDGRAGELGDGSTLAIAHTPVRVLRPDGGGSFGPAAHLAAGDTHTCAVVRSADADDEILCWGADYGATPVFVALP